MIFKNQFKILLAVLFSAVVFSGCGVWGNFTTYFNLYYNTSDQFDQAEESIFEQKRDLFSTEELIIPSSVTQSLNKVIEKASKILQFHSESGYVDDALLMLGKSFYYQKNYQKALRKFQELLATQQESDLALETKLWIGKTQMRLKDYDEGLATLTDVIKESTDEGEDDFIKDAYVEEIVHKIIIEDYQGAISLSNEFISLSDDDEVNAEIEFELGKLYNDVDDIDNAIIAFNKVFDYSPTYDIQYEANIELGKALRKKGRAEDAYNLFANMREEDKYIDNYDEIDLQTGITLIDMKNIDEAKNILADVDTSYPNSKNAGYARYELAQIFELDYQNFDSATVYYQKASTSQAPPEILQEASDQNQKFKKYNALNKSINEDRQSLIYVLNPEQYVKDSTAYFDSLKIQEDDSQNPDVAGNQDNLLDRGRRNTRDFNVNKSKTNTQKIIEKKPPVKPALSADSLMNRIAKSEFEIANLFFTEFNLLDSAYYHYQHILTDYPNSPYIAKTLFGIGSYFESKGNIEKADSIYNLIYNNYQNESIVNAAADKLKKPLINLNYDPAEDLYAEAEKQMMNDDYKASVNNFYKIFKTYHSSEYAPKALYASGWILENKLEKNDSAAVMYDSIAVNYPKTVYASKILPKLNFYKSEKVRIQKAIDDSIKALNSGNKVDSTENNQQSINSNQNTITNDSLNTNINAQQNLNEDLNSDSTGSGNKSLSPDSVRIQDENLQQNKIDEQNSNLNEQTQSIKDSSKTILEKIP